MSRRSHITNLAGKFAWITDPGEQYRYVEDADGNIVISEVTDGVTASPHKIVAYDVGDEAAGAALADKVVPWAADAPVKVGALVTHEGVVYSVTQAHTTQADWTPGATPALFRRLGPVGATGPQPWVQPTGAHDAYAAGARVTFQGSVYESVSDDNVGSPSAYPQGWTLISD